MFIKHNHCHHHRVLGFFVVIAMFYKSIGIGTGYWYRYSLETNIIGYWILGAFLGIVLTLKMFKPLKAKIYCTSFCVASLLHELQVCNKSTT